MCATIVAKMDISLPNVHMRGKIKTMKRKKDRQELQEGQEIEKEEALWKSSCWSRMELK
jgi:hypothetical protein